MDFNLDLQLKFSSKSDLSRLYSWYIQEFNQDGSMASEPLIPWDGNCFFDINGMNYCLEMSGASERKINSDEWFVANLSPSASGSSVTYYSILGTDRNIKDIRLQVKAAAKGAAEDCKLLGGVSFSYVDDFETTDSGDYLYVIVTLCPDRFLKLKQTLSGNRKMIGSLFISGVAGFYSERSPSISTSEVKVLVNIKDQNLQFDNDDVVELPIIGKVEQFRLTISCPLDN